ncbi:hypothetical protein ACOSQ3_002306 [Xanthoceras sorbifolium]
MEFRWCIVGVGRTFGYCLKFTRVPFWVQIHNTPLLCMTKDIGRFFFFWGGGGGTYRRCEPLRRCLRVDISGVGEESLMLLRNERLSEYCFNCGFLGHSFHDCLSGVNESARL